MRPAHLPFTLLIIILAACLAAAPAGAAGPPTAVLFRNVTVVPMDRERVVPGQDVLVRGGVVDSAGRTGSLEVPQDAQVVDGDGRYLAPGLADMHVHLFSEKELPLYLARGVTTVRNMWGWSLHLEMRERIEAGDLAGPTIHTTGPLVDGDPPRLRGSAVAATAADAERIVAEQVRKGFDAIKPYDRLSPQAYGGLILAARRYGVPVAGHVPSAVGIHLVLAAGQRTLEHLDGFPEAAALEGTEEPGWASELSPDRLSSLARDVRGAGAWVTPTLIVLERGEMSAGESEAFLARPEVALLPGTLKRFCCREAADPADDLPAGERSLRSSHRKAVVAALHRAGVPLLLGTDTGNRYLLPGYSLHEEIRLLMEAGLTAYEVLEAGTREAAAALGELAEAGTIEPGKRADLILVADNPLERPATLAEPLGVMVRGRWRAAEDLRALVAAGAAGDD